MEVKNWFTLNGDDTLALDWDLNENSRVWEIGGFEGRWAQQIWNKFQCHIDIFEPQPWAVNRMKKKFEGIEKIRIHPYGLWTKDVRMELIDFFTDGASVLKQGEAFQEKPREMCEFRNIHLEAGKYRQIDVALMNIEGAEYTLIPSLIEGGTIKLIKNFWCQFHPGLISDNPDVEKKISEDIFKSMEKTHEMIWNCFPTAVAWRKK